MLASRGLFHPNVNNNTALASTQWRPVLSTSASRQACPHLGAGNDVAEDLQVQAELPVGAAGHLVAPRLEGARVVPQHHDEVVPIQAVVQQLAHPGAPLEALQHRYLREYIHLQRILRLSCIPAIKDSDCRPDYPSGHF